MPEGQACPGSALSGLVGLGLSGLGSFWALSQGVAALCPGLSCFAPLGLANGGLRPGFRRGQLAVAALLLSVLCTATLRAQQGEIVVTPGSIGLDEAPVPIQITGFTGEVLSVLKFDLTVMGFKEETAENATYVLSGSNNGDVKAQLSVAKGAKPLLSQIYSGTSPRALAHRLADDVVLKLTGVNGIAETKIAFKVDTGTTSEIYISDFDGHNAQGITHDHTIVAAPCWVPGHLALYYTSYKLGPPEIFYHNLTTGERRNYAHYGGMNSAAAVSPDGKRVAMVLSKSGSPDIWVCDADGGNLKDLTPTREDESSPCWSPDGQWICFAGKLDGRRALCKVSSHGGPIQRISTGGAPSPSEPDWSPDGKWIVFTSQAGGFNICVVPAAGGKAWLRTAGEDPCWAPNSRTVVFCRRAGNGNRLLSLLDVPTKQVKDASRVSGRDASNSQPSWAR